jgi:glycosyltransferase involved in cell wall biosynthesis
MGQREAQKSEFDGQFAHEMRAAGDALEPRRVLVTSDTLGGVWSYVVELTRFLAASSIEVVLATMGGPLDPAQRVEIGRIPGVLLHESTFALEWMDEPWSDVDRAGDWLLALENRYCPDLVHLNGYAHGALPWRAPTVVVGHSCVLSWWRAVEKAPAPERYAEYRRRVRDGLSRADAVVAPTRAMLDYLRAHYGDIEHSYVIENGADPERFKPGEKQPFFLAAGRFWDRAKNLALLAEVAPKVPWPVFVAGELARSANADGPPASNLDCIGKLSQAELSRVMGRAAVFVHPALYEPFGLAPLEAALAGSALVLGDIASLREVWGDAALYVDPRRAEPWIEALSLLARDDARRLELARAAERRAMALTSSRMALAYRALYSDLVTARSNGGLPV